MKKITLLFSFIACVVFAQGQLLVNENFAYTAGTGLIGQGTWAIVLTSVTNPLTVTAPGTPAVTYTGYPGSGVGNELSVVATGQDITHPFTAQTSGSVYYSFLVNVSAAGTGDYFIHLGEPASTSLYFGRTFIKTDGTNIFFGVQNASNPQGSTDPTPAPTYQATSTYTLGTTYLIVVKVNAVTGASSLIINPDMTTEPATGWLSSTASTAGGIGGTNVPTAAGLGEINVRQGSTGSAPVLKLDGIHVATSYSALFAATELSTVKADALSVSLEGKNLSVKNVADGSIVDIYSSVGARVQSVKLANGSVQLNNLSAGLYIVRVGNLSSKIMM